MDFLVGSSTLQIGQVWLKLNDTMSRRQAIWKVWPHGSFLDVSSCSLLQIAHSGPVPDTVASLSEGATAAAAAAAFAEVFTDRSSFDTQNCLWPFTQSAL